METATRRLHRLTSYEPGRDWDVPPDDPAVLQDPQVNDFDRLPWFVKRYPADLRLSAGVVPGLLGGPHDGLLFTCLGVPLYQSSPAGPPGAPTTVRMVRPAG